MSKISIWKRKFAVKSSLLLVIFFISNLKIQAQDGEKLFKANCAACHTVSSKKLVGPGLEGVNDKYEEDWLIKWIKDSQALIKAGDADAVKVFEENNKVVMPPQPLSDEEVKAVLAYIKEGGSKTEQSAEQTTAAVVVEEETNPIYNYVILLAVAGLLLALYYVLRKARVAINEEDDKGVVGDIKSLIRKNKGMTAFVVVVLVVLGALDVWDALLNIGVHTGYAPEQPIKFSHKIHAGDDKIDCNYCHSSARHSKTSGIPSLNVCMNCHKYIDGSHGKKFTYNGETYSMEEEIQKLYEAIDWDPNTQTYGDNQKPVKWIKVHNLPDHVFFSHAQHVTAGKQECQTCHGPVEEMEVLRQESDLTMGWCVNCHRDTKIDENNGYYVDFHSRFPEEMMEKMKKDGKITVDEIGGLECAKCHY
ncbi:MAG: c-type cytochrome [Vicingaceae bacterium]